MELILEVAGCYLGDAVVVGVNTLSVPSADEGIVPVVPDDDVAVVVAVEAVVALVADESVLTPATGNGIVARAGPDVVTSVAGGVGIVAYATDTRYATETMDDVVAGACPYRVTATAARHHVGAVVLDLHGPEDIVARATVKGVVAAAADEGIVARAAQYAIFVGAGKAVPVATKELIVARIAL